MEYTSSKEPIRIVLYASEIGSILGLNRFCSRIETLKRVWYRVEGDRVPEAFRPSPDHLLAIARTKKGVQFRREKYSIETSDKFDSLVSELKTALKAEGLSELVDATKQFVSCEMGRNSERLAMDVAEANPSIGKCTSRQKSFCKTVWVSPTGDAEIVISGRIDCFDQLGRVMEIKTRIGRKPGIEPYEMAQLQTYLFLSGATSGYLVELESGAKLTVGPLDTFNRQWWEDEVVPALREFGDDLVTSIKANTLVIIHDISFEDEIDIINC